LTLAVPVPYLNLHDEFSLHEYVLLLRLYAQRGAVRIRHTLSHFPLVY
jgi:hypothetical protein